MRKNSTNGKNTPARSLTTKAELIAAGAEARAKLPGVLPSQLARIGVKPSADQYAAEEAHPATEWLMIQAVGLREALRRVVATAPEYVRTKHPSPLEVDSILAAKLAFLCDGLDM